MASSREGLGEAGCAACRLSHTSSPSLRFLGEDARRARALTPPPSGAPLHIFSGQRVICSGGCKGPPAGGAGERLRGVECKLSQTSRRGEEARVALRAFGVANSGEICSGHRVMWIGQVAAAFRGAGLACEEAAAEAPLALLLLDASSQPSDSSPLSRLRSSFTLSGVLQDNSHRPPPDPARLKDMRALERENSSKQKIGQKIIRAILQSNLSTKISRACNHVRKGPRMRAGAALEFRRCDLRSNTETAVTQHAICFSNTLHAHSETP